MTYRMKAIPTKSHGYQMRSRLVGLGPFGSGEYFVQTEGEESAVIGWFDSMRGNEPEAGITNIEKAALRRCPSGYDFCSTFQSYVGVLTGHYSGGDPEPVSLDIAKGMWANASNRVQWNAPANTLRLRSPQRNER